MTPRSSRAIAFGLEREGGYVLGDPPGSESYRGINRLAHPSLDLWAVLDTRKPIARGTIFPDLEDRVLAFYRAKYWDEELEAMPEDLALVCFDYWINSGAGRDRTHELARWLGRQPTPQEVIFNRMAWMAALVCEGVSKDEKKVEFWTDSLVGWMRRIQKNLREIRRTKEKR